MMRCSMLHAPRALDFRPIVTKQYHMSSQPLLSESIVTQL